MSGSIPTIFSLSGIDRVYVSCRNGILFGKLAHDDSARTPAVNHWEPLQIEKLRQLGQQLQGVRQQQGVSLEDVSTKTLIRQALLKALEAGDVESLPEPVYLRGFIRRYGDLLGLAGQELADQLPLQPPVLSSISPKLLRTAAADDEPPPPPMLAPEAGWGRSASKTVAERSQGSPRGFWARVGLVKDNDVKDNVQVQPLQSVGTLPSLEGLEPTDALKPPPSPGLPNGIDSAKESSASNWSGLTEQEDALSAAEPPLATGLSNAGTSVADLSSAANLSNATFPKVGDSSLTVSGLSSGQVQDLTEDVWAGKASLGGATQDALSSPAIAPAEPKLPAETKRPEEPKPTRAPALDWQENWPTSHWQDSSSPTPWRSIGVGMLAVALLGAIVFGLTQLGKGNRPAVSSSSSTPDPVSQTNPTPPSAPTAAPSAPSPPSAIAPTPSPGSSPSTATPTATSTTKPSINDASTPGDPVILAVEPKGVSWVEVRVDGSVVFEGELPQGSVRKWSGKQQIEVAAGRPDLVWLSLNGKPMSQFGKQPNLKVETFKP